MKRSLIVEIHGRMPFDAEMDALYDANSPEENIAKIGEIRSIVEGLYRKHIQDEGEDFTVNVYVSEEGE